MTKFRQAVTAAAIVFSLAPFEAAMAQSTASVASDLSSAGVAQDNFSRNRNVSVRERPRTGYESFGLRLGGFMAYPKLEIDGEYNDNVYATANAKVDDTIVRVRPALVLDSNWNRHFLEAYARASINRYADRTTENSTDWAVGANGRLDVRRTDVIFGGAEASRLTEPRTAAGSSLFELKPVRYDYEQANLSYAHTFNRLKLSGRGDWQHYNFDDTPSAFGGVVDEDNRDRTLTFLTGRADYAVSPDTALFLQGSVNDRSYRKGGTFLTPARDSNGYEILSGANFDITNLIRGEIGVGYLNQDFDSPAYQDIKGFGARAKVDWFVTPLTTVTVSADRSVMDSALIGSGGFLETNAKVSVDHEMLPNLILTANLGFSHDDYNGIERVDNRRQFGASATWLLNRRVGLNFAFDNLHQSSKGFAAGPDFTVNRGTVALILQY